MSRLATHGGELSVQPPLLQQLLQDLLEIECDTDKARACLRHLCNREPQRLTTVLKGVVVTEFYNSGEVRGYRLVHGQRRTHVRLQPVMGGHAFHWASTPEPLCQ
jgi:hypothetical protein